MPFNETGTLGEEQVWGRGLDHEVSLDPDVFKVSKKRH